MALCIISHLFSTFDKCQVVNKCFDTDCSFRRNQTSPTTNLIAFCVQQPPTGSRRPRGCRRPRRDRRSTKMTKVTIATLWFSSVSLISSIFSGSEEVKVKEEPEEAKPDLVLPEGEGEDGEESDDRKRKVPSSAAASDSRTPQPSSSPQTQGLTRSGSVDLALPSTSASEAKTTTVKQGSLP